MLLCRLSGLCSVLVQPVCQWGRRLQHSTCSMSGIGGQQVGWVPVYNHVNITQARSGVLFLRLKEHSRFPSVSSIKQMDPRTRTRVAATLWPNWEWVMGKKNLPPPNTLFASLWTISEQKHCCTSELIPMNTLEYLGSCQTQFWDTLLPFSDADSSLCTYELCCDAANLLSSTSEVLKATVYVFCYISVSSVMLCYLNSQFPICGHLSNNTVVLDGKSCFSYEANLNWCGYKYLVNCLSKRGIPVCSRLNFNFLIDSLTWRINSTKCVKGTSTLHNAHLLKYNSKTVILWCKWGRKSLFMSQAKFFYSEM